MVWSGQTAARLAADGVRLATCWDIAAAHRLLFGGWRADPGLAWARLRGLDTGTMPADGPLDLFGMDEGDGSDPVAPDGHLRPEWVSGGWSDSPERMARWAALALDLIYGSLWYRLIFRTGPLDYQWADQVAAAIASP